MKDNKKQTMELMPPISLSADNSPAGMSLLMANIFKQYNYTKVLHKSIDTNISLPDLKDFFLSRKAVIVYEETFIDRGCAHIIFDMNEFHVEIHSYSMAEKNDIEKNIVINFTIISLDLDVIKNIYAELKPSLTKAVLKDDNQVAMKFYWMSSRSEAVSRVKNIMTSPWDSIKDNYVHANKISDLFTLQSENLESSGKLILLHGQPGTGKSHIIRSLAQYWKPWTDFNYLLDPQKFFSNADYMNQIILNDESSLGNDVGHYQVFIAEDTDEFLQTDAKSRTGQGLSMLLNLTDGIVGQGLKMLFIITTNEPLHKLHPAVIRPGRCLANIEFPGFDYNDAVKWLKDHSVSDPEAVLLKLDKKDFFALADLYDILSSTKQINQKVKFEYPTGVYV